MPTGNLVTTGFDRAVLFRSLVGGGAYDGRPMVRSRAALSLGRLVISVALTLVASGCSTVLPAPTPRAAADAVVVVGRGVIDAAEWVVTVNRDDQQVCATVALGERQLHGLMCSGVPPQAVNLRPAWFSGDVPLLMFRLLDPDVAAVRALNGDQEVVVPTVSLAPLGAQLAAVAIAFPAGSRLDGLVYLAGDGTELSRDVASVDVPGGAADGDGDGGVTFGDGNTTVNVGGSCGDGRRGCIIQVGPDR